MALKVRPLGYRPNLLRVGLTPTLDRFAYTLRVSLLVSLDRFAYTLRMPLPVSLARLAPVSPTFFGAHHGCFVTARGVITSELESSVEE
jgi:hypothetical protein